MLSARQRAALRVFCIALLTVGLLGTAWFAYTDVFGGRFAVLCSDPEDQVCSGHYVHGVANEVWTAGLALVGVLGLIALGARARQPIRY